jgi:hypothetical protein
MGHKDVAVTRKRKMMLEELRRRNYAQNTVRTYQDRGKACESSVLSLEEVQRLLDGGSEVPLTLAGLALGREGNVCVDPVASSGRVAERS